MTILVVRTFRVKPERWEEFPTLTVRKTPMELVLLDLWTEVDL
jgi:hypothetical protein